MDYVVIIGKSKNGCYEGQLQEFPEVISRGKTIGELNSNMPDALNLLLDAHFKQTLI